jgi:hypothetical protein
MRDEQKADPPPPTSKQKAVHKRRRINDTDTESDDAVRISTRDKKPRVLMVGEGYVKKPKLKSGLILRYFLNACGGQSEAADQEQQLREQKGAKEEEEEDEEEPQKGEEHQEGGYVAFADENGDVDQDRAEEEEAEGSQEEHQTKRHIMFEGTGLYTGRMSW